MSEAPEFNLNDPAFLKDQLDKAVAIIKARDETTDQIIARLETQYAEQYEEMKKDRERSRKLFEDLKEELRQVSLRYAVLRQHQVRIRSLGILAKGKSLDAALDSVLKQMGVHDVEKLSIDAGVANAIRGTLQ